jgi:predicted O-methyltransferase YrrM
MSNRTIPLSETLYAYLERTWLREPPLLRRLREETAALGGPASMQIAPEQGQLMALLLELIGARRVLEVGTFTGYSSLVMALALPADGRLVTCDVSQEWTAIARRYWAQAGMAERIDLRLGPAVDTVAEILARHHAGAFDACFIDADKESYERYYELALELVRPGGILMFDNAFWGGCVADPDNQKPSTVAIRRLNARVREDERVSVAIVPIGDGLMVLRKR